MAAYPTNIPTDPHTVTIRDIKTNMCHIHTSIVSRHLVTRGNNKTLGTQTHISSSEEIRIASLVAPLPNSEQINHPYFNHTYTTSTPNHIHHHYVLFVTLTSYFQLHPHTHTTLSTLDLQLDRFCQIVSRFCMFESCLLFFL